MKKLLTMPHYWACVPKSTKSHWNKLASFGHVWVLTHRVYMRDNKPAKGTCGQLVRIASAKNISSKLARLDIEKLLSKGFVFVGDDGKTMTSEESVNYFIQFKMEQAFK